MKTLCLVAALVAVVGVSEARAERVSVTIAKGVVKVAKAVPCPAPAAWRGIKWVAKHA